MANTTFNGPVRSENGFQTISINGTTGAVTVTGTIGAAITATSTVTALSGSGLTAGGAAAFIGTNVAAGMGIYMGSGVPTIAAAKGSLYLRSDGSGVADRAYINTNGSTTWTALSTAA
jgi:hypothetical protein